MNTKSEYKEKIQQEFVWFKQIYVLYFVILMG